MKYINVLFLTFCIYLPLNAQPFYPPLGTLAVNDSLFVDFTFTGIDTWMAYLRATGKKQQLQQLQKDVPRRKREKTPAIHFSSAEREEFCQWRTGFVNKFKEKGTSDVPECFANDIYARMQKCDMKNEYAVLFRLPTQQEYALILQKLKQDQAFRKAWKQTKEAELLENQMTAKNGLFKPYKSEPIAFRCVAVYVKR